LWPQAPEGESTGDEKREHPQEFPLLFVGITLEELIDRFGPPLAVYAVRGNEEWQDDVVFSYREGDFYLYKDRVWQASLTSAYGIEIGDAKRVVFLTLGEDIEDKGDHVLYPLPATSWPLMLRVNISADSRVSAIFVYRPDF
jgi:hypothetical protein